MGGGLTLTLAATLVPKFEICFLFVFGPILASSTLCKFRSKMMCTDFSSKKLNQYVAKIWPLNDDPINNKNRKEYLILVRSTWYHSNAYFISR